MIWLLYVLLAILGLAVLAVAVRSGKAGRVRG